jgi:hypothetical protein
MPTWWEIRDLVRQSEATNWHKIEDGPTYRSRFESSTGPEQWRLEEDSHGTVAVYMPDVDLTIAYGMELYPAVRDREFDWSINFHDISVQLCFTDIFWSGSLVDRVIYALVDGARGVLPFGQGPEGLRVTTYERDVARLLHNIGGTGFGSFDSFFTRVPFELSD